MSVDTWLPLRKRNQGNRSAHQPDPEGHLEWGACKARTEIVAALRRQLESEFRRGLGRRSLFRM